VSKGLGGQDDNLDLLQTYFKELQMMTVEPSMDPDLDLLTFAVGAHYFGVIMLEENVQQKKSGCNTGDICDVDAEGEPEEDSEDVDAFERLMKGPSTAFPKSPTGNLIPKPITGEEYLALPEKEKVLRWREAFIAKIEGELDSDDEYDMDARSQGPGRQSDGDSVNLVDNPSPQLIALDKGKTREAPVNPFEPRGQNDRPSPSPFRFDSPIPAPNPEDFINWPEDNSSEAGGPPSTTDDGASSVDDFHSFDHNGMAHTAEEPYGGIEVLGRELLQFDDPSEPIPELPEIPEDPEVKRQIMESAIKYRDHLRAMRVQKYEEKRARKMMFTGQTQRPPPPPLPTFEKKEKPVGLIYLTTSQHFLDPLHMGECNIGAYIAPEYRSLDNAADAINAVVEHAFRDRDCHRLQAIIVDHKDKIDALTLFSSAGFRHEGIRRRAFFSSISLEWKDVTYLAMLATEWVLDQNRNPPVYQMRPKSLWDEVLTRHQREQEEIIKMQEHKFGHGGLKRISSTETIREKIPTALSLESGAESAGFMTDTSTSSSSIGPGPISPKRRRLFDDDESEERLLGSNGSSNFKKRMSFSSSASSFDSDWDMIAGGSNRLEVPAFRGSPVAGPSKTHRKTKSGFSSASSNSSSWSMMDD